jgi:glycosyltransferase involved in cell wall biosynthesis
VSQSKLIIELNEHPLRHFQNNWITKTLGTLKLRTELYFSDGVFCISNYLIDFLKSKNFAERKMLLVPSTVDPARFRITIETPLDQPYIGYFGGLTFERDSVDLLLRAFAKTRKDHSELKLYLGGFGSSNDLNAIKSLIEELNIQNHTILLGYLEREEVIKYMTNAKILVMVRANNLEAQASFPSKLPEYLACAKPVISVNVGEIPLYVTDGKNIFLVEPGNVNALSKKIEYVLLNYDLAKAVGMKGKELADTIFSYNYQARRMLGFVDSLN